MLLWIVGAGCYLLFLWWYTNTSGPLSNTEIAEFVQQMQQYGAPAERIDLLRRFMLEDDGGQFLLVDLVATTETPPGAASESMAARYMAHATPELLQRAGHPVFVGKAVFRSMDRVGIDDAQRWTDFALTRYRSRRDLLAIALQAEFSDTPELNIPALQKTIAYAVAPELYLSDARLLLLFLLLIGLGLAHALLPKPKRRFF